jgi:hypothetical protein
MMDANSNTPPTEPAQGIYDPAGSKTPPLSQHEQLMLDAAIGYAELGWRIFPVRGKIPILDGGYHIATTDVDQVRRWWTYEHPGANIGCACDREFWALDVDPRNKGDESLERLLEEIGPLPPTVTSETGGGGWHFLFLHNSTPIKKLSAKTYPGLDVQCNGYIVLPPSVHPTGRRYQWLEGSGPTEIAIAAAPQRLLDLVGKGPDVVRDRSAKGSKPSGQRSSPRTRTARTQANLGIDQARDMLSRISPDCDYFTWRDIGMAIHSAALPFEVWDSWSGGGSKYEQGECAYNWSRFNPNGGIGVGTLFFHAKDWGWELNDQPSLPPMPPTYPKKTGTVVDAANAIENALSYFSSVVKSFEEGMEEHNNGVPLLSHGVPTDIVLRPFSTLHVLKAETGSGKSYAARSWALADLASSPGSVGVILVSTQKLASEYEDLTREFDDRVAVRVYRGATQPDPDQPGNDMCHRPDATNAWLAAGAKHSDLCKKCPTSGACGTSLQKKAKADLWIVPSNMLFGKFPEPIPSEKLRWVLIDEDVTQYAIRGGGKPADGENSELLAISEATMGRNIPTKNGRRIDEDLTADFRAATDLLRNALEHESDDRLSTESLRAARLSQDIAAVARDTVWRLR